MAGISVYALNVEEWGQHKGLAGSALKASEDKFSEFLKF